MDDLDELLGVIGADRDPVKILVDGLRKCGSTDVESIGSGTVMLGPRTCSNVKIARTSRSCELVCVECGLHCEIDILSNEAAEGPEPRGAPLDDIDEFLSMLR